MHVILGRSQAAENDMHVSDMQCLRLLHDFFSPVGSNPTRPPSHKKMKLSILLRPAAAAAGRGWDLGLASGRKEFITLVG